MPAPPVSSSADAPALPGQTVRTVVSLVIFIHLFCVFLTLGANLAASPLQDRLLDVFRPYTYLLHLDVSYVPFYLTHGQTLDVDHRIEMEISDAADGAKTVVLPDVGWRGSERYKRYQRLARAMAFLAENSENGAALLAEGVGDNLLRQHEATKGLLRCRPHTLQDIDNVDQGTPDERNPDSPQYYRNVYGVHVALDGDRVTVLRAADTGEVAPVESSARPAAP